MPKSVPYLNEIVSLSVMLLMIIALVAGQADATTQMRAPDVTTVTDAVPEAPFSATFHADIDGMPLRISIDASAEFEYFRLEDE